MRAVEMMVNRDNVVDIPIAAGKPTFGELDLLSVDIDGNDLAVAGAAVDAWAPKILVAEYNAKFPWPLCAEVTYDVATSLGEGRLSRRVVGGLGEAVGARLPPSRLQSGGNECLFRPKGFRESSHVLSASCGLSTSPISSNRSALRTPAEPRVPGAATARNVCRVSRVPA